MALPLVKALALPLGPGKELELALTQAQLLDEAWALWWAEAQAQA